MTASGWSLCVRRTSLGLLGASLVIAGCLWKDGTSVQRGNRLYRSGDTLAAAQAFRDAQTPGSPPWTLYNLGTALLSLDANEAERYLRLGIQGAVQSEDVAAVQRGQYNLGYRYLDGSDWPTEPEAVVSRLQVAVQSTRVALRLDPLDENARWNLALAQRLLDSLTAVIEDQEPDDDRPQDRFGTQTEEDITAIGMAQGSNAPPSNPEGSDRQDGRSGQQATNVQADATPRSSPPPPDPARPSDVRAAQRPAVVQGAREAIAAGDPGALTLAQAAALVQGTADEPERLLRGLLWSQRPTVVWWEGQPFPGGGW